MRQVLKTKLCFIRGQFAISGLLRNEHLMKENAVDPILFDMTSEDIRPRHHQSQFASSSSQLQS